MTEYMNDNKWVDSLDVIQIGEISIAGDDKLVGALKKGVEYLDKIKDSIDNELYNNLIGVDYSKFGEFFEEISDNKAFNGSKLYEAKSAVGRVVSILDGDLSDSDKEKVADVLAEDSIKLKDVKEHFEKIGELVERFISAEEAKSSGRSM